VDDLSDSEADGTNDGDDDGEDDRSVASEDPEEEEEATDSGRGLCSRVGGRTGGQLAPYKKCIEVHL